MVDTKAFGWPSQRDHAQATTASMASLLGSPGAVSMASRPSSLTDRLITFGSLDGVAANGAVGTDWPRRSTLVQ
jgi:hypothetical protein